MSKRNKIKVGDYVVVRAECADTYAITNRDMKNAIVLSRNDEGARIEVLSHKDKRWEGSIYTVPLSDLRKTQPSGDERVIVVKSDGTDTVAIERVNGNVVKKTRARLHPNDEYKWETGRDLALNRLLYGTDYHPAGAGLGYSKKVLEGRAVCVECDALVCASGKAYKPFKMGKVYNFKNGETADEGGNAHSPGEPLRIIDGVWDYVVYRFIPITE